MPASSNVAAGYMSYDVGIPPFSPPSFISRRCGMRTRFRPGAAAGGGEGTPPYGEGWLSVMAVNLVPSPGGRPGPLLGADPVQHVPAQGVAHGDPRVVEVLGGAVPH